MSNQYRFTNKVAIVTGAGTGIGFEIAKYLVSEGAKVVLNDINQIAVEKAVEMLTGESEGTVLGYPGDAADVEQIYDMVEHTVSTYHRLDIVVANAGITLFGDFINLDPNDFRKVIDLNIQGTFFLVQAAARQMQKQQSGGRMVLMSSVVGMRAGPQLSAYAITKAAISSLASALVPELAPLRIFVNAVAPGATLTPRTQEETADYEGTWAELIPSGKVAYPEDIAMATLFLLSEEAKHINGHTLVVDGGWTQIGKGPENA